MKRDEYFWNTDIKELKNGYYYNSDTDSYDCLICGESFEYGRIFEISGSLYEAEKATKLHIAQKHKSVFHYILSMSKSYNGLTDNQKAMLEMLYSGLSDKEILQNTDATSTSTIRNQRFAFREKYKQAKITVTMMELLEEKREQLKNNPKEESDMLIDIHKSATNVDERYSITQAEKQAVISRYFDENNQLLIKDFPSKEKKKIIILQHIAQEFDNNKEYNEKQVNEVLMQFFDDYVTVRRYMIEYGFMERNKDCSVYRVKE